VIAVYFRLPVAGAENAEK